jgi:hypothetical protein
LNYQIPRENRGTLTTTAIRAALRLHSWVVVVIEPWVQLERSDPATKLRDTHNDCHGCVEKQSKSNLLYCFSADFPPHNGKNVPNGNYFGNHSPNKNAGRMRLPDSRTPSVQFYEL